jgi:hypothetical protein
MKRESELSEEESALLIDLMEENQHRLNAEMSRARTQDREKLLRGRFRLTQIVIDALSRESNRSAFLDDWPENLRPSGYC